MTENRVEPLSKAEKLAENITKGMINKGTRTETLEPSRASEANRAKIIEYIKQKKVSGFRDATLANHIITIHQFAEFMGNKRLSGLTKEDIVDYFASLQSNGHTSRKTKKPRPLKQSSIVTAQAIIRSFLWWIYGEKTSNGFKLYPDCVSWIKCRGSNESKIRKEDLFTEEEIQLLIDYSKSYRNKAIIAMLMESGARCSEFLDIRLKDLRYDKYGILVTVDGKTGKREIRLVNSVPYIKQWLKYHPTKDDTGSKLWVCDNFTHPIGNENHNCPRGTPLGHSGLRYILMQAVKEAKLTKPIFPHILRHSILTIMAGKLPESYLRQFAGWKGSSSMPATYVHLNDKNLDDMILNKVHNLKTDVLEEMISVLAPRKCLECGKNYPSDQEECVECRFPLNPVEIMRKEQEEKAVIGRMIEDKVNELLTREREYNSRQVVLRAKR